MIEAGEQPSFIARRLVICAAEDVGLADPQALVIANAAAQAVQFVGWPEGRIILSEAVIYVACAPKSNSAYLAVDAALSDVRRKDCGDIPDYLRDSHYSGAAKLGHGINYQYPHDFDGAWVAQQYLPEALKGASYYHERPYGHEKIWPLPGISAAVTSNLLVEGELFWQTEGPLKLPAASGRHGGHGRPSGLRNRPF